MTKQVTRMEVEGSVVEVRPIEPEVDYLFSDGTKRYRQRSLYEVYVDDVHRGYVYFPNGWGGCWHALSLRPQQRWDPVYHKHDEEERTCYGMAHFYQPLSPGALNETENWGEHARRWPDRNAILAAFPKIAKLGRAPSPEEAAALTEQQKVDYAKRKAEDAAREAKWAREREENKRRKEEEARLREERRRETLEGLESIRDRLGAQLTNLEMVALTRAIEGVTA